MIKAKNLFYLLILFLYEIYSDNVCAQNNSTSFQHLSIENGLSDNTVNCIVQDDQGFMWIGTNDGLNKFNGNSSKIFHYKPEGNSICSNQINCCFKDKSNRLWFGGNGLTLCYPMQEKFLSWRHDQRNLHSLGNNDVTAITQDENGIIWAGTRQGLFKFDETSKFFIPFLHDTTGSKVEVYNKNRIIDMIPDMHGNLWMSTIAGLYKFSIGKASFTAYLYDTKAATPRNHISGLSFDKNGKLWLAVLDFGLIVFDTVKNQFFPVVILNSAFQSFVKSVESIQSTSNGKIWIATTYNGILVFDPDKNVWQNYTHDLFDSKSLADNNTLTFFEDHSGLTWIGTARHGIDRLSPRPDKFIATILQPGKPNSLCENDITSACEDKMGNLWIGSKNGLIYYNRSANSFQCFKHDEKNANSLSHDRIYSIALDQLSNLWIATEDGLNYFNPVTSKWKAYFHDEKNNDSQPGNNVYDILVRRNGEIWAGTTSGFCRLRSDGETFDNEFNNDSIKKFTREYYITLFEDSRHTIWLSTSRSGIFNVDDSLHIIHAYNHSGGFNASTVHQFAEDNSGNIWMASDNGICVWKNSTATFSTYHIENGNLDGDIKSIILENIHSVWVTTSKGLTQLILNSENKIVKIQPFNVSDGLQSIAFNNCSASKLKSGELFFGGINGFNLFLPQDISYNKFIPSVQLSSFKVFDKEYNFRSQDNLNDEIKLNYHQNFFSFEMAAFNFDHPEKNQFAYQLEGFDKAMNYCGTNHFASYTNVPPGNYKLHIIASNNDGVWNTSGSKINIIIVPPLWKTNWFRILIILTLSLFAYLFYHLRIRKLKREEKNRNEINRQIAEARLTALSAQMNPHFIFNSLNSIQQFISDSEKENALKYLSKFSKLIRLVLQNANKNVTTISNEIKMLEYYLELEALRFSNKFTYHIVIDQTIPKDTTGIPSLLLQPYVENAVIHGLLNKSIPGHLDIKMILKENKVFCIIEDNGIGRAAATSIKNKKLLRNESLGMKVTEERMNMLGLISGKKVTIHVVDLRDENNNPEGTRVEIEIPIEEV